MSSIIERACHSARNEDATEQITVRVMQSDAASLRALAVANGVSVNALIALVLKEALQEHFLPARDSHAAYAARASVAPCAVNGEGLVCCICHKVHSDDSCCEHEPGVAVRGG